MTAPCLYAIGDLHGHWQELGDLMRRLISDGAIWERDTLVFLGDYVDGGPATCEVLMYLMRQQQDYPHWVFLKGNHEQMWLDAMRNHRISTDRFHH